MQKHDIIEQHIKDGFHLENATEGFLTFRKEKKIDRVLLYILMFVSLIFPPVVLAIASQYFFYLIEKDIVKTVVLDDEKKDNNNVGNSKKTNNKNNRRDAREDPRTRASSAFRW